LHVPAIAFLAIPLPLIVGYPTLFDFLYIYLLCDILFFEGYLITSNFYIFLVHDSVLLLLFAIAIKQRAHLTLFKIPLSFSLNILYLFILLAFSHSIIAIFHNNIDYFFWKDFLAIAFLLFAPYFLSSKLITLRNVLGIFFVLMLASSLYSLYAVIEYYITRYRVITWSEIFVGASIPLAVIHLSYTKSRLFTVCLISFLLSLMAGVLVIQTRGVWLASLLSLAFYFALKLFRTGPEYFFAIIRNAFLAFLIVFFGLSVFERISGFDTFTFIETRLNEKAIDEFSNPSSSMGHRIYESYMVWQNRTFFGHGPGSKIYMYVALQGWQRFMHWWAIHSGYFEILHKYGFIGLFLFISLLVSLIVRASYLTKCKHRLICLIGYSLASFFIYISVVSITSGYFLRPTVVIVEALFIAIIEAYYIRQKHLSFSASANASFCTSITPNLSY
jgi:O-antigen ligase